jgi:hypothetical protein
MRRSFLIPLILVLIPSHQFITAAQNRLKPTKDDGRYLVLNAEDLKAGFFHMRHTQLFGKYTNGFNLAVLQAIDTVQSHAMDGGGYFVGKDSTPTESPIGYHLSLFCKPLIQAPRTTSYCSGASYAAFIETLNILLPRQANKLSPIRLEALRMQEPDGGRREDMIKAWGYWNADGFGSQFCLVQYVKMGCEIKPNQLRPGDFVNISWKSGLGHSVIFLGWAVQGDDKKMLYWSSQRATNGMADQLVSLLRIKEIKAVRLCKLDQLFSFDPAAAVSTTIQGDVIDW